MKRTNTFVTMGANGLVNDREENDFYATEPKATELLLEKEVFNKNILEPCAGMGHMRDVLVSHGYNVTATDLIYRGVDDIKQEDVFNIKEFNGDIITNPPFSLWRQLIHLLILHDKKFLLIGNKTAIIYRELFYRIRDNKVWFGYTVPKEFITTDGLTKKISGLCRWYTNIEPRPMIEPIKLVKFEPLEHKEYTNYNAVNVDDIKQIPSTNEIIGVPITFLDKYNPEQFKILGMSGDREFADGDCDFFLEPSPEEKRILKAQNKCWRDTHPYFSDGDKLTKLLYVRLFVKKR